MDDANAYVALHAVPMHGGFSAASRRLGLPKATLSKRVARLEERLGVRLLERSTRNVRATDVGGQVFEQAQLIVAGLEAAAAVAASAQAEPNGVLRVDSPEGWIHGIIPSRREFGNEINRRGRVGWGTWIPSLLRKAHLLQHFARRLGSNWTTTVDPSRASKVRAFLDDPFIDRCTWGARAARATFCG